MNRDQLLTNELRRYLADRFTGIYSDLVNEAFPELDRGRRAFRIETLIEGIVRSLSRLSGEKSAASIENLLREAGGEVKALYPPDRHPLVDRLTEFLSSTLLREVSEKRKKGAA